MAHRFPVWHFAAIFALMAMTLVASKLAERRNPEPLAHPLSSIPTELSGWDSRDEPPAASDGVLAASLPTSYLSRTYSKDGQKLGFFIAYYDQQRAGKTMHSPKNCLPGPDWEIWDYDSVSVTANGRAVKINKYSVRNLGTKSIVLYWYQSRQGVAASEYLAKLLLIRDAISGKTGGSIVRITCADDPAAIAEALHFASIVVGEIQQHLAV